MFPSTRINNSNCRGISPSKYFHGEIQRKSKKEERGGGRYSEYTYNPHGWKLEYTIFPLHQKPVQGEMFLNYIPQLDNL